MLDTADPGRAEVSNAEVLPEQEEVSELRRRSVGEDPEPQEWEI